LVGAYFYVDGSISLTYARDESGRRMRACQELADFVIQLSQAGSNNQVAAAAKSMSNAARPDSDSEIEFQEVIFHLDGDNIKSITGCK